MMIQDISWIDGEYYEDEDFEVWQVKKGRLYNIKRKKYMVQLHTLESICEKHFMGIPKEEAVRNKHRISKDNQVAFESIFSSLAPYIPHTKKEFLRTCIKIQKHYGDRELSDSINKYFYSSRGELIEPGIIITAMKRDGFF